MTSFCTIMQNCMSQRCVSRNYPEKGGNPGTFLLQSRAVTLRISHFWTTEEKSNGSTISLNDDVMATVLNWFYFQQTLFFVDGIRPGECVRTTPFRTGDFLRAARQGRGECVRTTPLGPGECVRTTPFRTGDFLRATRQGRGECVRTTPL
ncbi:hypothetical protein TNCV_990561 [Trichonephila clavipes]|nr:hypothetical protein TNCV_990561 [Trichonephila clavipes]